MAIAYNLTSYTPYNVTLKKVGIHLSGTVVIQRSQIASVRTKLGEVVVDTTDGRAFRVRSGLSKEQRALVKAAFGL